MFLQHVNTILRDIFYSYLFLQPNFPFQDDSSIRVSGRRQMHEKNCLLMNIDKSSEVKFPMRHVMMFLRVSCFLRLILHIVTLMSDITITCYIFYTCFRHFAFYWTLVYDRGIDTIRRPPKISLQIGKYSQKLWYMSSSCRILCSVGDVVAVLSLIESFIELNKVISCSIKVIKKSVRTLKTVVCAFSFHIVISIKFYMIF